MPERTYTTHDIAKFCDVYPSSVALWIKDGKLRAYQTAGGHHRVTREDLIDFLRRLNMRLPAELVARKRVLIVDDDAELAKVVVRAFSSLAEYEVETCGDGINALIRIGQQPPDLSSRHRHPEAGRHPGLPRPKESAADQRHQDHRHQRQEASVQREEALRHQG